MTAVLLLVIQIIVANTNAPCFSKSLSMWYGKSRAQISHNWQGFCFFWCSHETYRKIVKCFIVPRNWNLFSFNWKSNCSKKHPLLVYPLLKVHMFPTVIIRNKPCKMSAFRSLLYTFPDKNLYKNIWTFSTLNTSF